ncbi:hypothetical protein [Desulfosporosinus sp. OT]|uniref:hypothetical protein n=1 Tax=Desulfosporosinus sp. OT TaxID=913865 RepID=UPI0002E85882|nr:hypothetical protein [Desulfosporosinus sp. OT]
MKHPFYTFCITIVLIGLAIGLLWTGKDHDGLASTIIITTSGYWLGQANIEKPVTKSRGA